jgi:RimJ/RimL family protein N-acetyltransferase
MAGSPPEIRLRSVEPGDLSAFYDHQRDPQAVQLAAFPPRDREAFTAHWARVLADDTVITRTVLADGVVAGNVVSFYGGVGRQVGYWIARDQWGRGVATGALRLLLLEIDERPLFATVAAHNLGSIRVLEKCGFVRQGGPAGTGQVAADGVFEVVLELVG